MKPHIQEAMTQPWMSQIVINNRRRRLETRGAGLYVKDVLRAGSNPTRRVMSLFSWIISPQGCLYWDRIERLSRGD